MTFKEKFKSEYTDLTSSGQERIIEDSCPYQFGYEKAVDVDCEEQGHDCKKCWNREMPNTVQKVVNPPSQEVLDAIRENVKLIPQSEVDAYNKGHADGVAQGMSDAWELANKIFSMELEKLESVFNGHCKFAFILDNFTPQEALAKLKAYEEHCKIEVGDILLIYGEEAVVTRIVDGYAYVLFGDGTTNNWLVEDLTGDKTGKHIDIKSILEQIGE